MEGDTHRGGIYAHRGIVGEGEPGAHGTHTRIGHCGIAEFREPCALPREHDAHRVLLSALKRKHRLTVLADADTVFRIG